MKESFLKDMYAEKNGVMNPWDGTQKDTYWDTTILFESYMFHTYTFPYQRELEQLAEQKACCDTLTKVPLRNEILKKRKEALEKMREISSFWWNKIDEI